MERFREISELEIGMRLSRDVEDKTSSLILAKKGSLITKELIEKLKVTGNEMVYINEEPLYGEDSLKRKYINLEEYQLKEVKEILVENESDGDNAYKDLNNSIHYARRNKDISYAIELLRDKSEKLLDHSINVAILSGALAGWLGHSKSQANRIAMSGLLHDLGKIEIPDYIIEKESLNDEEELMLREHPSIGYALLEGKESIDEEILKGILEHHEKLDGTGYPKGLKGEEISVEGRIVAISNNFARLCMDKGSKVSSLEAGQIIRSKSFYQLDRIFVDIFLENIKARKIGKKAILNSGEEAMIIYGYPEDSSKYIVKLGDVAIEFLSISENMIKEIID